MIGKRFGKVTVLSFEGVNNRRKIWRCLCDCGNVCLKSTGVLNFGNSSSCGCGKSHKKMVTHGYTLNGNKRPEWRIWVGMRSRCYTKSNGQYRNYGGRG